MEAFLVAVMARLLAGCATYTIHVHQGKPDLLRKLGSKLNAYAKFLPRDARVVVLLDRDDEDCHALKTRLEGQAAQACLATRATAGTDWRVLNRIAVEELEAWFFGNWPAVQAAYPKVKSTIVRKSSYRHCDAVAGGTWEAFERVLQGHGYFTGGLRKTEAAREIGTHFDPKICTSPSFAALRTALLEALA